MRRRRPRARWLIICVVAILLLGEVAGRIVGMPALPRDGTFTQAPEWSYPDWFAKDAALFWRYRPNQTITHDFFRPGRYTINSNGFRGPDFEIEKAPGVTRVVCLGESNTFGLGVSDDAVWPRQMERRLNALDTLRRRWEVINLGVTNYSSLQGLRLARRELVRLKPDFVVYSYSWADHQLTGVKGADDEISLGPAWQIAFEGTLNRLALVRWARHVLTPNVKTPSSPLPGLEKRRVSMTQHPSNIEKIAQEIKAVGARAIMATSPVAWPPPGQTDTSGVFHIQHRYRRLARFGAIASEGEFVELAVAFDSHPEFYDDRRTEVELFNARGHAFTGEFMARYILGDTSVTNQFGSGVIIERILGRENR